MLIEFILKMMFKHVRNVTNKNYILSVITVQQTY